MKKNFLIFRKSPFLLITKILILELIINLLYLLFRIPKTLILPELISAENILFLNEVGLVYFLGLSVLEVFFIIKITLDWGSEEFEIRDESLIHRKGILNVKENIYSIRNLGSTNIRQNFLGKIFNYGTITITSPILKYDIILNDVHNPKKILAELEDNIENSLKNPQIIKRRV